MPERHTGQSDDDLEELPPIDGDLEDVGETGETLDQALEVPSADSDASNDSVTPDLGGYPDDFEERRDDTSWLDEAAETPDLDLGSGLLADLGKEAVSRDDAPLGQPDDDDEPWDEPVAPLHDDGDEGPLAPEEELRDGDLPSLDADEDGEGADASFMDARFAPDDLFGVQWVHHPWSQVGAPLGLKGAKAVVCAGRYALVAAEVRDAEGGNASRLAYVDLEGGCALLRAEGLPSGHVHSLATDGTHCGMVGVVLDDGRLFVSHDGGASFNPEACWDALACCCALGVLWVSTESGLLLGKTGPELKRYPVPLPVDSLAADGGTALCALLSGDVTDKPVIARFGAEASCVVHAVEPEAAGASAAALRMLKRAGLAARAGYVAYNVKGGILRRGVDYGWRLISGWEGHVTAMTFIDNEGTLLAAVYSEADDVTGLIRLDGRGRSALVAQVTRPSHASDGDARVSNLACDDVRGIVWVSSAFGVTAFSIGLD